MTFQRIGILSIGEMGFNWARLLISRGVEVLTYDRERSAITRERAANAGVKSVDSMPALVSEADLIVSLVVPTAANQVALDVAAGLSGTDRKDILFLDANAISPMTAQQIEQAFSGGRVNFVDGCIIGSSAKLTQGTLVYLSGPEAERVKQLEQFGFSVRVLGADIGQASAFKIIYAGLTKGMQSLMTELLVCAKNLELDDRMIEIFSERFPDVTKAAGRNIAALPVHAARRAEEMGELRRTFQHYGLKSAMAPAAQAVLESIAALKLGQASADGTRKGTLLETLKLFCDSGLLRQ